LLNKYIKSNFGGERCGSSTTVDIRRLKVNMRVFETGCLYACLDRRDEESGVNGGWVKSRVDELHI